MNVNSNESLLGTIGSALLIDKIKNTIKNNKNKKIGNTSVGGIQDFLIKYMDLDGDNYKSLTQATRKVQVTSTAYVEDSLVNTDIAVPLMGTLNQIYLGYVLTALNLYNSIGRSKTLSDMVGRVANEGLSIEPIISEEDYIDKFFGKNLSLSLEAKSDNAKIYTVEDTVKHLACGRIIEFEFELGWVDRKEMLKSADELKSDTSVKGFKGEEKYKSGTVTVSLYVSLRPVVLPDKVATQIFELNFPLSFKKRLMQVKTGEIRLFKDFFLSLDLIDKHKKALKVDKSNVLNKFYIEKTKKNKQKIVSNFADQKKNNLASSMIVISKDTYDEVKKNINIDLENANLRQKFFDESFTIMLVIVDEMYEMVDIYYNGIGSNSEIPYKAIKQVGLGKSGVDMADLMKTIAKGGPPRF